MSFLRGLNNNQKEMVAYLGAGVITLMIVFVYVGDRFHFGLSFDGQNVQTETTNLSDTGATSYFQDNFSKAFSGLGDIFKTSTSSTVINSQVGSVVTPVVDKTDTGTISDNLKQIEKDINEFNSQFGTTSAGLLGQ